MYHSNLGVDLVVVETVERFDSLLVGLAVVETLARAVIKKVYLKRLKEHYQVSLVMYLITPEEKVPHLCD